VTLADKVVVITGSTRGIGRAMAEACAAEGASVVVCSRDEAAVARAREALRGQGRRVSGIAVDVARPGDLERLLQHALDAWGRVDVWVNNAGLSSGYYLLDELTAADIARVVDVNLFGTLNACRIVLSYFVRHGGGVLVNVTGKGGRGEASPHLTTYAATKAAVTSLTKSLAQEYRRYPISVHALLPGMVPTDFYRDMDRQSSPRLAAEVAGIPYVLRAIGVPASEVGRLVAEIAAQTPGKETGKLYSAFKGRRLARGIAMLTWYRLIGKIKG